MELRSGSVHQSSARTPSAPVSWDGLPSIVQQQILRELANDYDRDLAQDKIHRAAYAAVCLEWQGLFEASAANFGKLVLHPSALDGFQRIIRRRHNKMPYIRHIWLRIELQEYTCKNCENPETGKEIVRYGLFSTWMTFWCKTLVNQHTNRNNIIFTQALWKLLDILSTWEKSNINLDHQNLTLEFSAHSPSDSQHAFQNVLEIQNAYPYLDESSVQRQYMMQHRTGIITDLFQRLGNRQSITVPMAARLVRPLDFDFSGVRFKQGQSKDRLPEVKMVTSFLIRRQYYRDICTSALARLYNESLPNLRTIRHERWRLPHDLCQQMYDWSYGPTQEFPFKSLGQMSSAGSKSKLPSSLESLHLFEDFNATIHGSRTSSRPRPSRIQILKGLATAGPGVKHLTVSFLSDAMDCLEIPDNSLFPNLESIALTSQTCFRPTSFTNFNVLLHKAALAARKMPKLQIMEIWNCENGYAAIFRYEATGAAESSACRLTWRCSWYPASPIQDRVVKAWETVASTVTSRELLLDITDPLPPRSYPRYGCILGQLKLRSFILDPISQMQVRVGTGSEAEVNIPVWKPTTPYLPTLPVARA